MKLWIDFNDNSTFESSESLTNQGGIGTGFSNFSITIPANADPGSHRMRISLAYSQGDGSALNPCTTYSYGEVHDYTANIFSPTGCVSPSNLLTSNLSQNGATLSWTASAYGDAASSYNYEIRTSGAAGSGGSGLIASGTVTNPTVNIVGLIVSTNYTAYVQANCAGPAQSLWISKSFRTPKFVAVSVTGFNVDIIANGIGNASVSTNSDADAAKSVFIAQDFQATGSSALPSLYLPNSRELANGDVKWMFADYSSNNALRLKATTSQTGALTFSTPQKAKQVSVLAVLGSGGATSTNLNGTITFTDNSTQTFSNLQYRDWGTSMPNTVTSNVGSLNSTTNVISYDGRYISANTIQIDLANQNKEINKIDFTNAPTNGSSNVLSIMAISIDPACANPVVFLGNDTTICSGNTLTLDVGNPGMSYLWNDNSTAQTLDVTSSGTYSVTVTDGACSGTDAINVTVDQSPSATGISSIANGNNNFTFQVDNPQNVTSYTYDFGDGTTPYTTTTNYSVNHTFSDANNYTITLTLENGICSSQFSVTTNAILPVEMDLLKAVLNGKGQAVLSWNTFSERNNKGFVIEKSTDGREFEVIDFVSTKAENGNSNDKISYHYTDLPVLTADAYYRLIQTDIDEKTTYSNIAHLSVKESADFEMLVHPNPVAQVVTIQLKGNVGAHPMITITDILGKVLKSLPMDQMNMNLDVSSLASGVYFIKYNDDHQTQVLRLSKE